MTRLRFLSLAMVLLFLVGTGCDTHAPHSYRGNVVEIVYSRGDTLRNQQWLKIDDHKFVHIQNMPESDKVEHPLPTTQVVVDSTSSRDIQTEVSPLSMSLHLTQQLGLINDEIQRRGKGEATYRMGPQSLIRLKGTVRLSKTDSSVVRVQVSPNYPAKIRVLE